ncbi:CRISPR-associated endoribonuclease Cas2 [Hyphomonas atlantica]|uniref:CRISPR-associated endoribonuclease Cas2 n=1 Tax=Hyphomonas atlantica TaxID=1280948 RepID=A0A059E9L3_9PROT|nr:CRISPR-associated endoribonuclease Cas2 [Hyphomonas atlantica]KCZ64333.1 hypothetical protein HY36_13360 [Hyphomonas atlantica]
MAIYLIAYDLRNETGSHDYQPLWDRLEELDCHKTQYSVWLGNFSNSAKEVHDHLKTYMDDDDRLMVSEFTKYHWYSNAIGGTNEWLKKNPPQR